MIEIPLDDDGLQRLEDSMAGAWAFDDDGNRYLKGGDFTLHQLLEWYSEYDPALLISEGSRDIDLGFGPMEDVECFTYPNPVYSEHDLIRALIKEVRRLRATGTEHD